MCRVIVADDEYLEREVIKKVISDIPDVTVIGEANNGRVTIELCKALNPEIIFINYSMGGMSGLEASKKIRETNKDLTIIMTTGHIGEITDKCAKEANINEVLLKPIKPSKIKDTLEKYSPAGGKATTLIKPNKKPKGILINYPRNLLSPEIKSALDYIDNHYKDDLPLEDIAARVYLSTYYFSHLFKSEVGVNFSSYTMYKKIEAAKHLLETTDKTILEISACLNFNEQTYFSKVFKKYVGETPSEYRKQSEANRKKCNRKIEWR